MRAHSDQQQGHPNRRQPPQHRQGERVGHVCRRRTCRAYSSSERAAPRSRRPSASIGAGRRSRVRACSLLRPFEHGQPRQHARPPTTTGCPANCRARSAAPHSPSNRPRRRPRRSSYDARPARRRASGSVRSRSSAAGGAALAMAHGYPPPTRRTIGLTRARPPRQSMPCRSTRRSPMTTATSSRGSCAASCRATRSTRMSTRSPSTTSTRWRRSTSW